MPTIEKVTLKGPDNGHSDEPVPLRSSGPRRPSWLGALLWALAVLIIGAYVVWPRPQLPAEPLEAVDARRSLGEADAPVVILAYSDFACPDCREFNDTGVMEQIRSAYGSRVRFTWRDFPVASAQSPQAAEAALCAGDQGQFWAYHDRLFSSFLQLKVEQLKGYAKELGLDTQAFNHCLDSGQHWPEVQRDLRAARQIDRISPPVYVINGQVSLIGFSTFDDFKPYIDAALEGNDIP